MFDMNIDKSCSLEDNFLLSISVYMKVLLLSLGTKKYLFSLLIPQLFGCQTLGERPSFWVPNIGRKGIEKKHTIIGLFQWLLGAIWIFHICVVLIAFLFFVLGRRYT